MRLGEDSQFAADASMLSLGSDPRDPRAVRGAGSNPPQPSLAVRSGGKQSSSAAPSAAPRVGIMKNPRSASRAPFSAKAASTGLSRSNSSGPAAAAQRDALLKLPKFSKNSFSSNLDPNFGASNSEWVSSFAEASCAVNMDGDA